MFAMTILVHTRNDKMYRCKGNMLSVISKFQNSWNVIGLWELQLRPGLSWITKSSTRYPRWGFWRTYLISGLMWEMGTCCIGDWERLLKSLPHISMVYVRSFDAVGIGPREPLHGEILSVELISLESLLAAFKKMSAGMTAEPDGFPGSYVKGSPVCYPSLCYIFSTWPWDTTCFLHAER